MNKKSQILLIFAIALFILFLILLFVLFITFFKDSKEESQKLRNFCIENGYYDYDFSFKDINYDSGYCFNSKNEKRYFSRYKDSWRFEE